jgi:hypothetical protein
MDSFSNGCGDRMFIQLQIAEFSRTGDIWLCISHGTNETIRMFVEWITVDDLFFCCANQIWARANHKS